MRTALVLAGYLSLHASLVASPVPTSGKDHPVQKRLQEEALSYAQRVFSVVTQVSSGYIRPVPQVQLLESAIRGLFEEARQPLPTGLLIELRKQSNDTDLVNFLVKVRMQVGNGEALRDRGALLASCRAMLKELDPFSGVVLEKDRKNQPRGDQPAGIGLELADNVGVGPQRILRVLPGTPAQRAGIRPGDEITHLDGKPVKGMTPGQAAGLLRGKELCLTDPTTPTTISPSDLDEPPGPPPPAKVRLLRPGRAPWTVSLAYQDSRPESVFGVSRREDNSWDFLLDRQRRIAHVRIVSLNHGTASELSSVLSRLEEEGLHGLILDLRWSPGGFFEEAKDIAGLFLGKCVLATLRGRQGEVKHHNIQPGRFRKVPLVVLVNGETSGGAELIAAALQDDNRAAIAGQRTFGKASVQKSFDIADIRLKLTSDEFIRRNGKSLHRRPDSGPRDEWGIRPDPGLESRLSPELMRQLRQQWEQQTLRPGTDNKVLPLDDPSTDPQRQLALQYLQERMKK
jgi:carboxyl-terminal processing protease